MDARLNLSCHKAQVPGGISDKVLAAEIDTEFRHRPDGIEMTIVAAHLVEYAFIGPKHAPFDSKEGIQLRNRMRLVGPKADRAKTVAEELDWITQWRAAGRLRSDCRARPEPDPGGKYRGEDQKDDPSL